MSWPRVLNWSYLLYMGGGVGFLNKTLILVAKVYNYILKESFVRDPNICLQLAVLTFGVTATVSAPPCPHLSTTLFPRPVQDKTHG